MAPHSPLLTASAGLVAGVLFLSTNGGWLASALVGRLRDAIQNAAETPDLLKSLAEARDALAPALLGLFVVVFAACVLAHQLQVGGLWAPGRLSPSWSRLWRFGQADGSGQPGVVMSAVRGSLARLIRLLIFVAAVVCVIGAQRGKWVGMERLEFPTFARFVGQATLATLLALAMSGILLGVLEFWFSFRRFEQMLMTTPDEQRNEQKAIDGDPSVRSRRAQLARNWMRDPGELIAGTSLVLEGRAGLTVLLAGSPPPGRVTVRTIARGIAASTLRHGAERAGVPVVRAPDLARWFAAVRVRQVPLSKEHADQLSALWPSHSARKNPLLDEA
jgi:flagellar biosynthetic protein FlhB